MNRPITTLFMLMSVDGKISTGSSDNMDFDKDLPTITGLKEGLQQYYDIEQTTDLWSLNSGRVQAKLSVNEKPLPNKTPISFVLIDNKNLDEHGIEYFCELSKTFILITTNKSHPAFKINKDNMHIILQEKLSLSDALAILKDEYGCDRLTIQSGGILNSLFVEEDLIDYLDIVVTPVLIGGKDTPTLIDGKSITNNEELTRLGILELIDCIKLDNSYLRLKYKVKKRVC